MENKPVILQVLPALGTGGVERGTVDMAKAIIQAGGIAIVASEDGIWQHYLEKIGAIYIHLPLSSKNPWIIWKNHYALIKIIQYYKVDIVHARSRAPAWSAWLAAKKCHIRFVTTWHGVFQAKWFGKRWYNQVMTKGEKVIAISHYIANHLQQEYHVNQQKLCIIPRGVDLTIFDPSLPLGNRISSLAQSWGISEEQKILLLPGRITEWKGHKLLLQAFAELKFNHPNWICIFVGPAKEKDHFLKELLDLADYLKIKKSIYFVGNSQDMPAVYALANIVVVPSLKPEPFGRVVIEAQAMEKPVVVANHGGAAETVEENVTGYLFKPGSVNNLVFVLDQLMEKTDADLNWIGRLAREAVQKKYTLQQMQCKTLSVYNEILPAENKLKINDVS